MNLSVFDKDTILDLTVNIVPLIILGFFGVLYVIVNPWGMDNLLITVISHGMLIFTFLGLAALTYVAAIYIEKGTNELEEGASEPEEDTNELEEVTSEPEE